MEVSMGYIQVTRRCNRECVFCSNPHVDDSLSIEEIRDQIEDYRKKGVNDIVFTGGEPTLNEALPEAVRYCTSTGLECRIITNGHRLADPGYAKRLSEAGLRNVMISVYSHVKEKEEKLTCVEGGLELTLRGIRNVSRHICPPKMNVAINALNAEDLDKTVEFLAERFPEIPHFTFNYLDPGPKAQENPWSIPRYVDIELSLPRALEFLAKRGKTFRVERVPLCYLQGFEEFSSETRRIVKGQVYRCYFLDEPGRQLRELKGFEHVKGEACKACSLNEICGGVNTRYARLKGLGEIFPVFRDKEGIIQRIRPRDAAAAWDDREMMEKLEEAERTGNSRLYGECDRYYEWLKKNAVASEHVRNLQLMITRKCQLRCRYCPVEKSGEDMSLETAKMSVDVLMGGRSDDVRIDFLGGEPLLVFDRVREVVRYATEKAKEKGKKVSFFMITNALGLTKEINDFISKHDFLLELSLDGDEKTHNEFKIPVNRTVNPYREMTRNIRKLFRGKIRNYGIMVVMPGKAGKVLENFDHMVDLGFRNIHINYAFGVRWDEGSLDTFMRELDKIREKYGKDIRSGRITIGNASTRKEPAILNSEAMVDTDGSIHLLPEWVFESSIPKSNDLSLGNIRDIGSVDDLKITDFLSYYVLSRKFTRNDHDLREIVNNNIDVGRRFGEYFRDWQDRTGSNQTDPNFDRFLTYRMTKADLYPPVELYGKLRVSEVQDAWRATLERWRSGKQPQQLGLFVYVPFCMNKCFYCRAYSYVPSKGETERYLKLIGKEAGWFRDIFQGARFNTTYIGGGTPTYLSEGEIRELFRILEGFRRKPGSQVVFESSPGTLNREKLRAMADCGVNRLSLGIQSMDRTALRKNARLQDPGSISKIISEIRDSGIRHISVDVIAGLRGESVKNFERNIRRIAGYGPDFINIYWFEPTRETLFTRSGNALTEKEKSDRDRMTALGKEIVQESGFQAIKFTNFGRTPQARNIQETDTLEFNSSLLGLGYNARSHAFGQMYYSHFQKDFIKGKDVFQGTRVGIEEEMRKFLICNLRTGFSRKDFSSIFDIDVMERFGNDLESLERSGLVEIGPREINPLFRTRKEHLMVSKRFFSREVRDGLASYYSGEYDRKKDYLKELDTLLGSN